MNRKQARRAAIRTPTPPQGREARKRYLERNGITMEYLQDATNKARELDSMQAKSDVMAAATENEESTDGDAALLVQAIEMTVQDGQTSTSMLQRRLRIGYARAGRLIDEMEKRGIVSAKDNAKPRQCLITRETFEQMKQTGMLDEM